jgi:hypothetical protein
MYETAAKALSQQPTVGVDGAPSSVHQSAAPTDGATDGGDDEANASAASSEPSLSNLAIMVALAPEGDDHDALEALLQIETRDKDGSADLSSLRPPVDPSANDGCRQSTMATGEAIGGAAAADATTSEAGAPHRDPLLPLTTPPEQSGRHLSHETLQAAQHSKVRSSVLETICT